MSEPKITRRKVSDYTPDPHNANKGTERGQYMIDKSVESVGLARSIVAASDGTIPAGNKTLQAAADAGIEDVIEVETDGNTLVVVKRADWDTVDSEAARKYAYLDNRASEVGLEWSPGQIIEDQQNGVDLSSMWFDHELEEFADLDSIEGGDLLEIPAVRDLGDRKRLIKMALYIDGIDLVERAISETGERNRGNAILEICRAYLNEEGQFDV